MGEKFLKLSEVNLEGQFLGFVGDVPRKSKYLRLAIPAGDVLVKIPKELRNPLSLSLEPGARIHVYGFSKLDKHTGKIKLKAYQVSPVDVCSSHNMPPHNQARIMVCQKSGCLKRGGKGLLSELEKTLCDRGLLDKVQIEHTGCQKRCSSAPNCVLQLGKKKYKKVHPEAIASLLESHINNLGLG